MAEKSSNLPCQKKGCNGEMILLEIRACNQFWKCMKCQTPHYLSHGFVAYLKEKE